jgi:putative oxidoreductase
MGLIRSHYRYKNLGLLLLRIGIGVMFMLHGLPKLMGGPEKWAQLGRAVELAGIDQGHIFWGFMAGFAEVVGGFLFAMGLLFRSASLLLLITMLVATFKHVAAGDGFGGYAHAAEASIMFFSMLFIGPGKYSLDSKLFMKDKIRRLY